MTFKRRSAAMAPDYALYRQGVVAADSGPYETKEHGINMGDYRFANIQVLPGATDDPDIEVMFWSDHAGKFIAASPAATVTGAGAGVAYEYTVACNGRIMFVAVTGTLADGTDVLVSGYSIDHTL